MMNNYGKELTKDAQNRNHTEQKVHINHLKFIQIINESKQRERDVLMQKQMQADLLDRRMNENKKTLQNHLANDYNNATRRKNMRMQEERQNNLSVDNAINSRVNMEMDYLNTTEKKKKDYIQQMYRNEKKLYDISKQNELRQNEMNNRESQDLVDKNIRQSYDREMIFKNRYKFFNNFQDKVANDYRKNVLHEELRKNMKRDQAVKKNMELRNKKLDEMDHYKRTFYDNWNQSNKNVILNQINHKNNRMNNEREKMQRELVESFIKQDEVNNVDFIEMQQKKMMQSK